MCKQNFVFLCCGLFLLITSSSKSQQIFINNKEKDDNFTVRYELNSDSTTTDSTTNYSDEIKTMRYDLDKKFINNSQYDEMQYKFQTNNNRKGNDSRQYKLDKYLMQDHKDDEQIPMNSHTNSTNVNHKRNFTSQEVYENLIVKNNSVSNEVFENSKDSNESNIVPYEMCHNITCIQLCCPLGHRSIDDKCIPEKNKHLFPYVYANTIDSIQSENKRVDEFFQLAVYNPCKGGKRYILADGYEYDYMIYPNGSIYLSLYTIFAKSTSYCLGIFEEKQNIFQVTFCSETVDDIEKLRTDNESWNVHIVTILVSIRMVSMLFLMPIFLVYFILPELRNVHGFILCNYCGAYFISYIIESVNFLTDDKQYSICVTLAFLNYFFSLSANFWLITISFDMWWTFRRFCSLRKNIRQGENSKLVHYAIFAWGCPLILGIFCVIMESISSYLPEILRPEFQLGDCWFNRKETFMFYFYDLRSVCIVSSVCLSISAALKIARYEKDTKFPLTDLENKRYYDNKKWSNLYLKLFIVQFILLIIQWIVRLLYLFNYIPDYVGYYIDVIDILQHLYLCIFIIFVYKKKIKLMLLKRCGCVQ